MSLTSHRLFIAAAAALVAACADAPVNPSATPPPTDAGPAAARAEARPDRPGEVSHARLAREIPGFGGFYFEDGTLVAVVTDPRDEARVRGAMQAFLRGEGAPLREHMRGDDALAVRGGEFAFTQLQDWRDRANPDLLQTDGVVFTSLNQVRNRLVVGVSDAGAQPRVAAVLRAHGVPPGAVATEVTGIRPNAGSYAFGPTNGPNLRARVRPLQGGLMIPRLGNPAGTGCTLGFVATWNSGTTVYVTSSHCSTNFWATDATQYFQNVLVDSARYRAGHEEHDPNGYTCLAIYKCRWSDAAIVLPQWYVDTDRGYIARTTGAGSITVDPTLPPFKVVSSQNWPVAGATVHKMGQKTGWSTGTITGNNCMDINFTQWQKLHCQVEATYHSDDGDSGAPVFFRTGGAGDVVLYGVHSSNNAAPYPYLKSIFSPMGGIRRDLGTLDVNAPATTTPPPEEPCGVDADGDGRIDPC